MKSKLKENNINIVDKNVFRIKFISFLNQKQKTFFISMIILEFEIKEEYKNLINQIEFSFGRWFDARLNHDKKKYRKWFDKCVEFCSKSSCWTFTLLFLIKINEIQINAKKHTVPYIGFTNGGIFFCKYNPTPSIG